MTLHCCRHPPVCVPGQQRQGEGIGSRQSAPAGDLLVLSKSSPSMLMMDTLLRHMIHLGQVLDHTSPVWLCSSSRRLVDSQCLVYRFWSRMWRLWQMGSRCRGPGCGRPPQHCGRAELPRSRLGRTADWSLRRLTAAESSANSGRTSNHVGATLPKGWPAQIAATGTQLIGAAISSSSNWSVLTVSALLLRAINVHQQMEDTTEQHFSVDVSVAGLLCICEIRLLVV